MNLEVSEIFFSLNGEGVLIGIPTLFIRLSGCNLRCTWCDTRYAWKNGKNMAVENIVDTVQSHDNGYCFWTLLTGGEPLLQDIEPLIKALHKKKYLVGIETNGSLYESCLKKCDFISVDLKPPSSGNQTTDMKTFKKIIKAMKKKSGQIKAVIADSKDYAFVKEITSSQNSTLPVVLQPCWETLTYKELCELYFADPLPLRHVLILPQIHKIAEIK
jgi:7-carboxy-7-deazaguanine synthase